ncbi:MAG: leucyl aminopeptidase [Candidatus Gastranaerophilales bacterium]|nr:leucyl aminopeptidase [Candidatus Gastranaerophilales bacterium]
MRFLTKNIKENTSDIIITFIYENQKTSSELFEYLNELSNGELAKQIFEFKTIKGSLCETFKYSINKSKKVIVAGLGKKECLTRQKFSQVVASAARCTKNIVGAKSLGFELIENKNKCSCEFSDFSKSEAARIIFTSARIGLYEFNKYLSDKKETIESIVLIDNEITSEIEYGAQVGAYTSFAMKFAKDLINESAQIVTPEYIACLAQEIAKEHKLEAKIFNLSQIQEQGMNAFLAVGQGSTNEPKFIHLTYRPKNGKIRKKIALIGKGITFDSGGLDIKPATSMLTMKTDMSGTASVLGVIQAIAKIQPEIELHVISALCENMPSGKAYKQGDVLVAKNGKTIEVDNTDAEGRITLADALCYADTLEVDEVIDIATLTGAVIVSLGHNITGVMGNNQKQIDKFIEISKLSCENTWQMPILEEMKDNLKSEIADMKNTGGRNAGTSTAAWFLSNFTKSNSWLHLDIAGTAAPEKSNKETLGGPTGVMIRTLINYLIS